MSFNRDEKMESAIATAVKDYVRAQYPGMEEDTRDFKNLVIYYCVHSNLRNALVSVYQAAVAAERTGHA